MNRRTCPSCGGRSYSSSDGAVWDCPYCGRDMGHVSNELCNTTEDFRAEETFPDELQITRGVLKSENV